MEGENIQKGVFMKSKLVAIFFTVLLLLGLTTISMADAIKTGDSVSINYLTGYPNGTDGGPFLITQIGDGTTITSFCLERSEFFTPRATYTVTIDDGAIGGGISGGYLDPVSNEAAYLYLLYLNGYISKVDALQVAIWKLEGESGGRYPAEVNEWNTFWATYGADADALIALAEAAVARGYVNTQVKVLNLWDGNTAIQSQLINVPEPLTILMLGLGLFGLGVTRRFKK